jgi:hypothetical protein
VGARFRFDGFDAMREALNALPVESTGEAKHLIEAEVNGALVTLKTEYGNHAVTRRLMKSVKTGKVEAGQFGAATKITVSSAIAWLFDNGSQARQRISGGSTGTMWGRTPPTHVFVRTMITARARLKLGLTGLLERAGLLVRDA